jgi:hypothetical protein
MILKDVVDEVQRQLDDNSQTTKLSIKQWLNDTMSDVVTTLQDLGVFESERIIRILPQISGTGAVVTLGSRIVNFPVGTLTCDYTSAFVRLDNGIETYRLIDVSSTGQATLDHPYSRASSLSVDFLILQDTYYAGSDVEQVVSIARQGNPLRIEAWDGAQRDLYAPSSLRQAAIGLPYLVQIVGRSSQPFFVSYFGASLITITPLDGQTALTIALNNNPGKVLSPNGLFGVVAAAGGDQICSDRLWNTYIRFGNPTATAQRNETRLYRINNIRTDPTDTFDIVALEEPYQKPLGSTSNQCGFTIGHFDSPILRFYPIPNVAEQVQVRFQKRIFSVEDDGDVLPFPDKVCFVILQGTLWKALDWIGRRERSAWHAQKYQQGVEMIRQNLETDQVRSWSIAPWNANRRVLPQAIFPSNFDNSRSWV